MREVEVERRGEDIKKERKENKRVRKKEKGREDSGKGEEMKRRQWQWKWKSPKRHVCMRERLREWSHDR